MAPSIWQLRPLCPTPDAKPELSAVGYPLLEVDFAAACRLFVLVLISLAVPVFAVSGARGPEVRLAVRICLPGLLTDTVLTLLRLASCAERIGPLRFATICLLAAW